MPKGGQVKAGAIKKLEGNRGKFGKARIKQDPPGLGVPRQPSTLSGEALALWRDVVASLPDGLLTQADETHLECFAREWQTYREADAKIQSTGLLVKGVDGQPVRNPLIMVRNQACTNIIRLGGELGLSPVARARLSTPNQVETDPMALLLGEDMDPHGAWSTLPPGKRAN